MLKYLIKIAFTIALVIALKSAYYNYITGEFEGVVDAEYEEYDPDDYEDDNYAYDDYDTESDW